MAALSPMKYRITLIESEESWAVWCDDLPGCCPQGGTREEAVENTRIATTEYLDAQPEIGARFGTRILHEEIAVLRETAKSSGGERAWQPQPGRLWQRIPALSPACRFFYNDLEAPPAQFGSVNLHVALQVSLFTRRFKFVHGGRLNLRPQDNRLHSRWRKWKKRSVHKVANRNKRAPLPLVFPLFALVSHQRNKVTRLKIFLPHECQSRVHHPLSSVPNIVKVGCGRHCLEFSDPKADRETPMAARVVTPQQHSFIPIRHTNDPLTLCGFCPKGSRITGSRIQLLSDFVNLLESDGSIEPFGY